MAMNPFNIAVLDDETAIRQMLSATLASHGYTVELFAAAMPAMVAMQNNPPDLLLLDLGLPDHDGQIVITTIRSWSQLPIIVLSARDQEAEKVTALEAGADDYLTKPFSNGELLARIKVALRRTAQQSTIDIYEYGNLKVNLPLRRVWLNGSDLHLTPTEYKLLAALIGQAGRVVTQSQLIRAVWGQNSQGNNHYLRIYIQHLRNKLQDDPLNPTFIITEAGIGYRLKI